MASTANEPAAYDRDYWAWTVEQVRALSEGRVQDLDLPHLAEEIADLGKSEERRLESDLARLLEHLLKLRYMSGEPRRQNLRGWQVSLRNARRKVRNVLAENPGLKGKVTGIFPEAYLDARDAALIALDLAESEIPEACPWDFERTLAENFKPE